jgi:hypothetical protein
VGGTRWNFKSFADREPVAMIGTPGLDGELTSQHEIMVRALAVIMPGNDIAIGQRKDTNLNVRADNDGLDAFHLVVGHLEAFRLSQNDPQSVRKMRRIAEKLTECALNGEPWAIAQVADRIDGKPKQESDVSVASTRYVVEDLSPGGQAVHR